MRFSKKLIKFSQGMMIGSGAAFGIIGVTSTNMTLSLFAFLFGFTMFQTLMLSEIITKLEDAKN